MITTETPHYELTGPIIIGSRLLPAIPVGNGFVSVEAHAIETNGRAHFRVHIDIPGIDSWTSEDSYVTTLSRTWTHAAMMALETVCDALGDEEQTLSAFEGMPPSIRAWLADGAYMNSMCAAENLREAMFGAGFDTAEPDVPVNGTPVQFKSELRRLRHG